MSSSRRNYPLVLLGTLVPLFVASCGEGANNPPTDSSVHIPPSAVAWLPAEGTPTDVITGRQATLQGTNCYGPGKVSSGFQFDGTWSTCMLPDTNTLDMTSSLTLLCWAKLDTPLARQPSFAYYSDFPFLLSKGNGDYTKRNYGLYFHKSGNALHFNGINETGAAYVFAVRLDSASRRFDDLAWHLVGGVWNRTEQKAYIYIDGQVVAWANGANANLATNDLPLMIGAGHSDQNFIKGSFDEVMVFSRALSASEIQTVLGAGAVGCVR